MPCPAPMSTISTKPPSGTRDFFPEQLAVREHVIDRFAATFRTHAFARLDTPALERIEVLSGKYGDEGEGLIFKILKRGAGEATGEADLALRYDLTVPLARIANEYQARLGREFRRYQIGPVWRAERPGRGRFREFFQCDIDVVGVEDRLADAEVIVCVVEALRSVGLSGFAVSLNSRAVLTGLLEAYDVPAELASGTLVALDKYDKIGAEGVRAELADRGLADRVADALVDDLTGPDAADVARERLAGNEIGTAGLREVDTVLRASTAALGEGVVAFNPLLARGLAYYTGPIFEVSVDGVPGSIAGGGRYDNLLGIFGNRTIPATGGSIGLERILLALQERDEQRYQDLRAPVLVTVWSDDARLESFAIAQELRRAGIACEIALSGGKIGKQLSRADERGFKLAVLVGPDEAAAGEAAVKDLRTGEQTGVPRAELPTRIAALLDGGAARPADPA
jgi:histidyl-tRNA synthetase